MTKTFALALFANETRKEFVMTKLATLAAAFVLFAPVAVAILAQAAQIVA
jgi:multisubunit Na+/H+ antiporter MnhG subunit